MRNGHPTTAGRVRARHLTPRPGIGRSSGFEAQADWASLKSPETYLGYEQARGLASPNDPVLDQTHTYVAPDRLNLNRWALAGDWTIERRASVLDRTGGRILFRFHARDIHLVLGPRPQGASVPFRVLIDGEPPSDAHGLDTDEQGRGTVAQQRLHQLIRQPETITDRTLEITFLAPGVEAYVFTFG
jgi:hypothetical protein